MKRKLFALTAALCLAATLLPEGVQATGETPEESATVHLIGADITGDPGTTVTWEAGHTYVILKDTGKTGDYSELVEIGKNVTLTIHPGAKVLFGLEKDDNKLSDKLIVHGKLHAEGAAGSSITIGNWYKEQGCSEAILLQYGQHTGIIFIPDNTTGSAVEGSFQYCNFDGGGYKADVSTYAAVAARDNQSQSGVRTMSLTVDHCVFESGSRLYNYDYPSPEGQLGSAIFADLGAIECTINVSNCTFGTAGNPIGQAIKAGGTGTSLTVTDCTFQNCQSGGEGHDRGVIDSSHSASIRGCTFQTKASLPNPIWIDGMERITDRGTIENNTFSIISGKEVTLAAAMSGLPIESLQVTAGRLKLPRTRYDRFELCITHSLSVSTKPEAGAAIADNSGSWDYVPVIKLAADVTVTGLTLYKNGQTYLHDANTENWCLVTVNSETLTAPKMAMLILATYNGDQMTSAEVKTLYNTYNNKALSELWVTVPTDGTRYKLFLLDSNGVPLCPAWDSAQH